MFKNSDHAKKGTKSLFDFTKENPKAKLSEFRSFLSSVVGYRSFFDFLNNQGVSQEAEEVSLLDLIQSNYAVLINDESFGRVFIMSDEIVINYDTNANKDGIYLDEVSISVPMQNLMRAKIHGSEVVLTDNCDEEVKLAFYLPMNSHQVKVTTHCDLITVRVKEGDSISKERCFANNTYGKKAAKECFELFLGLAPSSNNTYSQDDTHNLWNKGESFAVGSVEVVYELSSEERDSDSANEVQIAFDIESGSITQTIEILNNDYDEDSIIEGLNDGTLATTTWHGSGLPEVIMVKTDEVIAIVQSQEVSGEYIDFR